MYGQSGTSGSVLFRVKGVVSVHFNEELWQGDMKMAVLKGRLRVGVSSLQVTLGRYLVSENEFCQQCYGGFVEDTEHYLLHCAKFCSQRLYMWSQGGISPEERSVSFLLGDMYLVGVDRRVKIRSAVDVFIISTNRFGLNLSN